MKLHERLRWFCDVRRLSALELNRRFRALTTEVNCSHTTVRMWLQGKVSPRYDQLEVLAQVFGVPLEELLGLSFAGLTPEESHIIHQLRRMERTDPNSPEGRASFAVFLGTRQTFPGKGSALPGSSGAEPNNKTKRARQKNKRARVRK